MKFSRTATQINGQLGKAFDLLVSRLVTIAAAKWSSSVLPHRCGFSEWRSAGLSAMIWRESPGNTRCCSLVGSCVKQTLIHRVVDLLRDEDFISTAKHYGFGGNIRVLCRRLTRVASR